MHDSASTASTRNVSDIHLPEIRAGRASSVLGQHGLKMSEPEISMEQTNDWIYHSNLKSLTAKASSSLSSKSTPKCFQIRRLLASWWSISLKRVITSVSLTFNHTNLGKKKFDINRMRLTVGDAKGRPLADRR